METAQYLRSYLRLAAIRALGVKRESVFELYNRSDRMLRLWVDRFNEGGIDALVGAIALDETRDSPVSEGAWGDSVKC